jgi:hypothetical protein
MSAQMVLLPVFVLVGLTFALLLWMAGARRQALVDGEAKVRDVALGQPNWPTRATQIGNSFSNQFELPVLFYILIALALPLRHADLGDRAAVLGIRGHALRSRRHFCDLQRSEAALARLVRRRAGAVGHVDLLRAENSLVDLSVALPS